MLVLQFGGMTVYAVESRAADGSSRTAADAIGYTFVRITTVGYVERYPGSNAGRILGMAIMRAGVGLFGILPGYLPNAFLAPSDEPGTGGAVVEAAELKTSSRQGDPDDPRAKVAELKGTGRSW